MSASVGVSGVKSAMSNKSSGNYPAIPKIKIKFEGYSPDGTERVKRPKIVRTEEKHPRPASVPGSKGQCLTCHQCRQSVYSNKGTLELKIDAKSGKQRLKCSKCTRYWCERCLINRYGMTLTSLDPLSWMCPFCMKKCNCSVCRKKEGKLATGIMAHIAKNAGYQSVSDFLDEGMDDVAKILQWKAPTVTPTVPKKKSQRPPGRPKVYKPVNDSSETELNVSFKHPHVTPNKEQVRSSSSTTTSGLAKITVQPPKNAGSAALPGRPASVSPLRVSCVVNKGMAAKDGATSKGGVSSARGVVSNGRKRSCSPSKWTQLEHSSYNIFMQETDPFLAQVDQSRTTAGWVRQETIVIDLQSEQTEFATPFHASPLPFGSLSRSPTPVRPARERRNPGRYSSNEYDLELMETESASSEDNAHHHTPIFRFKSPDCSLRVSSSPESFGAADGGHPHKFMKLSPHARASDLNIRCGVQADVAECGLGGVNGTCDDELTMPSGMSVVDEMRHRLTASKREQYEIARQVAIKAQRNLKKQQEQEKKADLLALPKEPPLVDDSVEACRLASIPALPTLPPLHLPLPSPLISSFLFVSEFLFTFQEQLNLRRRIAGEDLCSMIAGGRGLGEIYRKLLNLTVAESSDLWKELKSSNRQRELERVAKKYLLESGKNGFLPTVEVCQSLDESLVILNHLCHHVLEMGSLDETLEESRVKIDQMQREHKSKERDRGVAVKEELQAFREKEGSGEAAESKRREFITELQEMKEHNRAELYSAYVQLRNEPLGRDRQGRLYWNIQSLSAVVVECVSSPYEEIEEKISHRGQEIVEDNVLVAGETSSPPDGRENGSGRDTSNDDDNDDDSLDGETNLRIDCVDEGAWLIISSNKLLEELINCLHPNGRREQRLKESLSLLKGTLSTS